ncbi:YkgJ family cysteine cluster protein [Nanoarchaeota archaeon]
MTPEDVRNKDLCEGCDGCCKHLAIELDTPEDREDYSNIMWYLLHENVRVFIDHEDEWYIEFLTKCTALNEHKLCDVYDERPDICRDYTQEDCVKNTPEDAEKVSFSTREDFITWLEQEGIDWKSK